MRTVGLIAAISLVAVSANARGRSTDWGSFFKGLAMSSQSSTVLGQVTITSAEASKGDSPKKTNRRAKQVEFAKKNFSGLRRDVAVGSGERLDAFAKLMRCGERMRDRLGNVLNLNYDWLFADGNHTHLVDNTGSLIAGDPQLADACDPGFASVPIQSVGLDAPEAVAGRRALVMPLHAVDDVDARISDVVGRAVTAHLAAVDDLEIVSTRDLEALVQLENDRDLLGCETTTCLSEIGNALGAEWVIYGSVGWLGGRYSVSLNAVETKGDRVTARTQRWAASERAITVIIPWLVKDLVAGL